MLLQSDSALRQSATAAGEWLRDSGIQEPAGGVARYHRSGTGNLPVSTEITGYAVSGFLHFYRVTGDSSWLDAARRAARFLLDRGYDRELRVFRFEIGSEAGAFAYFFDSGIIARGLLSLWRVDGDPRLLEAAQEAGVSMIRDFEIRDFEAGEGYHPIIALPSKEPLPDDAWWSKNPGCFQLKAALAWRELHEITGHAAFREHYERQLLFALQTLPRLLSVETEEMRIMDRLHAWCYFLEGLMPKAERPECRAALASGIAEIGHWLRKLSPRFVRSDVHAQMLRIRLLAAVAGAVTLDAAAASEEAAAVLSFQEQNGCFRFGDREGLPIPHFNPVSTCFAAQAIEWWRQYGAGVTAQIHWRELI